MNTFLFAALTLCLVVAVITLVRETRLRRALQKLLKTMLSKWRQHEDRD